MLQGANRRLQSPIGIQESGLRSPGQRRTRKGAFVVHKAAQGACKGTFAVSETAHGARKSSVVVYQAPVSIRKSVFRRRPGSGRCTQVYLLLSRGSGRGTQVRLRLTLDAVDHRKKIYCIGRARVEVCKGFRFAHGVDLHSQECLSAVRVTG